MGAEGFAVSAEATAWVWRNSPYKGVAFTIHLAIADVVNDMHDNEFWAHAATVAEKARTTRETVSRALNEMVHDGLLEPLDVGQVDTRKARHLGRKVRFLMPNVEPGAGIYESVGSGPQVDVTSDHIESDVTSDHVGCDERSHRDVTSDHIHRTQERTQERTQPLSSPKGDDTTPKASSTQEPQTTLALVATTTSPPSDEARPNDGTSVVLAPGTEGADASDNSKSIASRQLAAEGLTSIATQVMDAWVAATGREASRVRLNDKRRRAVKARMVEGYTKEDLIAAVRGVTRSEWHMGKNPQGKCYNEMTLMLRDGESVEKFAALERGEDHRPGDQVERAMRLLIGGAGSTEALGS